MPRHLESEPRRFLSLGAGVQSSTLALMIAHGEVPMVDAAIFADTQWEPKSVYRWLDWLEQQVPFPVHRVTRGNIRHAIVSKQTEQGYRFASIPWHMQHPDGRSGMGRRQCTNEYKLEPIRQAKRQLLGYAKGQRITKGSCVTLIGISTDEASRAKDSNEVWNANQFPLLDARMSRQDCLRWMERHGYPAPPKSSCLGCPYHSDAQWRAIKADPEAWADVIEIDAIIRQPVRGIKGQQFMHRRLLPLAEVDFSTAEERGQVNLFENECEGICGV